MEVIYLGSSTSKPHEQITKTPTAHIKAAHTSAQPSTYTIAIWGESCNLLKEEREKRPSLIDRWLALTWMVTSVQPHSAAAMKEISEE